MSTTALDALYTQVRTAAAPVVSLSGMDRRRDGDTFATIPVAGLELTVGEAAAALFETAAEDLALPVPSTDALYAALTAAVNTLGPTGIAEHTPEFEGLDGDPVEWPEVATCRRFAYRLALSFWYAGARSRPMTAGEVGAAVYLSSLNRYRAEVFRELPGRKLLLARAIHEGATAVPTETLIRLGAVMGGELGGADRDREREWLYKQALPDYHRRRFAFDLVRFDRSQPAPLVVRPDSGGYTIGLTPPPGPDGTWLRPLRAEW
ncbi:hypothetical protein C9F11_15070 [Streptomyces sp. YIM 121038]|uniref:hypothetical protein n=1 Tax=Streptomyces sp. YIM 121038 TaxID=2136401 RepID=UPI0011636E09|nr:hypothetical protein [Streptomyces sp. YIM 121038]QCX76683.1 hypothetical protein C9F11_15070 [Streptomyces sp. YIM 121038]